MTGATLIAAERARQQHKKGWTAEHDDGHTDQSILLAAQLIINDECHEAGALGLGDSSMWAEHLRSHVHQKYHDDPIRRLTIAGAMIAAEIDRLTRAKWREAAKC